MRKNSPAHKQSTLASTTQTKLKSQDEIVGKLTAEITNLEKAVERLQNELLIKKLPTTLRIPLMVCTNINDDSAS